MAAQVPVPNVVSAKLTGNVGSYQWNHLLHYQYSGGAPTESTLITGAGVLYAAAVTHIMQYASAGVTLTEATLTDLASELGAVGTHAASTPGAVATPELPGNVAFLISKSINRRYRGGHPRCYLPVGTQAQQASPSTWLSTFVTTMANAYAAFITQTANGGMWAGVGAEVCVHRSKANLPLATPTVDIVQSYNAQPQMASQRRRIGRK